MLDTEYEFTLSDGETYRFAPITLRDWSAFVRWCNGVDGRPPDAALSFDAMMERAQTLDGMVWLCHRSLAAHHRVDRDRVLDLLGSLDRLARVVSPLMTAGEGDEGNPRAAEEASA